MTINTKSLPECGHELWVAFPPFWIVWFEGFLEPEDLKWKGEVEKDQIFHKKVKIEEIIWWHNFLSYPFSI